ncbi:TRAP-type C4-dicarboxylate transport system permease small subunit [Chromohalobacter marismortui]|uniref:TRAP transporter small permease protein n=1 Tax=Chromohalobacter marismortui TaxID=42055 RepID=A0A4V3F3L9_9GAMM|nr:MULTISPECIES: TRAP transporter small permease [Chromohalobacter]MCI0509684.1 TRAP transporter small permease [Chromohalobacter sp.]MCI0593353.1 TRAP transporter small permease [Chromohalobacter sp.]TDU21906.1 TRAP-type C4-dicarboxylate transport system permease small subunit [Chromohalobacter marismortui]
MSHFLTQVTRTLDRFVNLSSVVGTLALIFAVLVTVVDVTGRFFGAPLTGGQDLSQMTMVIIVFGGMALCDQQGGNIAVDIFENKFPARMNYWLDIAGWVLGCAIFTAIGYTMLGAAEMSKLLNLSTNIIGIPKAPFQYIVAFFAFLTALSILTRIVKTLLTPSYSRAAPQKEEDL